MAEEKKRFTPKHSPAVPGMTYDEDAVARLDPPDEPGEPDTDPEDVTDDDRGALAVKDDDTIGVDADDDAERGG